MGEGKKPCSHHTKFFVSLQHVIVILGSFTYFAELFPAASIDFLSMVHVKILKIANGSIWGDCLS